MGIPCFAHGSSFWREAGPLFAFSGVPLSSIGIGSFDDPGPFKGALGAGLVFCGAVDGPA